MKLFYKYYLMIAIPLICCLFIIGISLSFQMYNYSVSEKEESLKYIAEEASSMTEALHYNTSYVPRELITSILSTMTSDGSTHIIICNQDGKIVLTSSNNQSRYIGASINPKIIEKTEDSGSFSAIGTMGQLYPGENITYGTVSRTHNGKTIAYIYVTTSISNTLQLMRYVAGIFFLLSAIVFLLTAIISYFLVKKMTKPLNQIATASKKFASGDFSSRVPLKSSDEIGDLTTAFNNMADSIEKSEKLRQTFIANVSHELRSPMTSITGLVDGILDETIPPEASRHYLEIVSNEGHRLTRLINRMLDITVLQSSDISATSTKFDLCELVSRIALSFEQRLVSDNITLNINFSQHSIFTVANEDAIYQVVYNLIDNAIKFSNPSTAIDISVTERSNTATFSVKNYGAEIPKDQLQSVFDRFHKTDSSRSSDRQGLGLGLYIAKTIIDLHKGKIWVESENGYTEFCFSINKKGISSK